MKTKQTLKKTVTKLRIYKNKIKRALVCDNVNALSINNMNKKPKTINASSASKNYNYFSPLQTIEEDKIDDDDEVIVNKEVKVHIPPITILKCKIAEVQEICKLSKIKDYSIRKISIGLKLFLKSKADYETICSVLTGKYEFFSYATKDEKPYKALLFGLDKQDPLIVKKN